MGKLWSLWDLSWWNIIGTYCCLVSCHEGDFSCSACFETWGKLAACKLAVCWACRHQETIMPKHQQTKSHLTTNSCHLATKQWVHVSTASQSFIACISLFWFWRPKWITFTKSKFPVCKHFTWTADTSGERCRLFVAAVVCSDWMLRISSSIWNVSFDWLRSGAHNIPHNHLLILTYLHRHNSIASTCFTEAVDTKLVTSS